MPTYVHSFSSEQAQILQLLHELCANAPSAIVAGGWVRDVISGHTPKDIDVFLNGTDLRQVLERLPGTARVTERAWSGASELRSQVTSTDFDVLRCFTTSEDHPSSGEMVESVWEVNGLNALPIQLIEVDQPLRWVQHFDALCNMLYVTLEGAVFEIVVCSVHAVSHAKLRVWEVNPAAQESKAVLARRAEKFAARGFEVRKAPVTVVPDSGHVRS